VGTLQYGSLATGCSLGGACRSRPRHEHNRRILRYFLSQQSSINKHQLLYDLQTSIYNPRMPLVDQIQKDIVTAMKAKDEARLSCLRMIKSALQLKTVEKMSPLDDRESQAVLNTLIKQRKDSIEQFTKGGRQEMADKEAAEITVIEGYLPKAASEADIAAGVKATIAEMGSPTMKDMGSVMKNAMAKFAAAGMRVDGKVVSELVKKELAGK